MVEEKRRRCHSTSEAPLLTLDLAKRVSYDDDTYTDVMRLLPNRQTSTERRDFSRRLSLTTERMRGARRPVTSSSNIVRTGPSFVHLLDTGDVATHKPAPMTRRMSVLVDQQRQPIALLQSNGKGVSIRPVLSRLTSGSSINQLFDDPYGVAEEPRTSHISMPDFTVTSNYSANVTDKVEFERQCQWKGEGVKRADYMLLNITALFIIVVTVAAIIFFSVWRDVSGQMWALYLALGIFALLVLLALLLVKLHFYLKSRGYNLLFRQKECPPAAPPAEPSQKKSSERTAEMDVDIEGYQTGKLQNETGEGLEEAESLL